jgi:hypothetical protein
MHRKAKLIFSIGVITIALTGCQSHQEKIDSLQRQYEELEAQFRKDCTAEYMKVPPTLSPKCADEKKNADDAYKRLQDKRATQ